jgi:hypothetical protein
MERLEQLKAANGQEAPVVMMNDVEEGGEVSHERKQRGGDVKREAEGAREANGSLSRSFVPVCVCVFLLGYAWLCVAGSLQYYTRA